MRPDGTIGPRRHQRPAAEVDELLIGAIGTMWEQKADTREMARRFVIPEATAWKALQLYRARQREANCWEVEATAAPPLEENKMALYRKKPTANEPFEAVQWRDDTSPRQTPAHPGVFHDDEFGYHVITIHGQRMRIKDGDWILPEPDGVHFYPCRPEVFADRYQPWPSPPAAPGGTYPGPMNGDRAQFELEHANTRPEDRPDWPLPSFDARDWAKAFIKVLRGHGRERALVCVLDEGFMGTWFANALMRGHDEGVARSAPLAPAPMTKEVAEDLTKRAT